MKIVRIIARLNVGGPAKHVVWLTKALQTSEYQSLLVAGMVPSGEDDMGYFASDNGVAPIILPEMSREISLKDVLTIWKLYRLFRQERPDVVHTHTAKAGTVGRVAGFFYRWLTPGSVFGRPRRCRFVHTYHGHIFHSYYSPLKTRLFVFIEKALARLITDSIVVVSQQQQREIREDFGVGRAAQFRVIPLGIEIEPFTKWRERGATFREEIGADPGDIVIGIVGRLTEIKNHELFLEAMALYKKEFSDPLDGISVLFVIIGDGALRNKLEQKALALGVADGVFFAGSRRDPENFYPALDVVALTSRNEGTPLTLIEAMANARPIVAMAVGGVVDLLGDPTSPNSHGSFEICERGIRVPLGDARAFAAGLKRIVVDAPLRREMGERGLRFVEQRHSKERLLEDVRTLYVDLLKPATISVKRRSSDHSLQSRV